MFGVLACWKPSTLKPSNVTTNTRLDFGYFLRDLANNVLAGVIVDRAAPAARVVFGNDLLVIDIIYRFIRCYLSDFSHNLNASNISANRDECLP